MMLVPFSSHQLQNYLLNARAKALKIVFSHFLFKNHVGAARVNYCNGQAGAGGIVA
jgi:hypothetical protein